MSKITYPLIIRVSRINRSLILSQNKENVYRIHLNGVEEFNGLKYDEVSDKFNNLEDKLYA